jgi:phage gp36-like protein
MAWLSNGDIEARMEEQTLLSLADDDGDLSPDANVLDAVRADAEALVEGHLSGRYEVPLSVADKVAVEIATSIAIHRLYLRKNLESPQHVKDAFAQAVTMLARIAAGEAHLALVAPVGRALRSSLTRADREFTRDSLESH